MHRFGSPPSLASLLLVALVGPSWAQVPVPPGTPGTEPPTSYPRRSYETRPLEDPPKLDGVLDDACWAAVEWGTEFVQWEPAEGQAPSQQTAFKILYDASHLYIAYRAYDSEPNKIRSLLSRRDNFPGDWVEINIDSYHDHRTAYSFTSSVSGVRGDEFISQDGDHWDPNWDPIWELATHVDSLGWSAEARIPLSQLRFADRDDHLWGIQVQRRVFRQEERSLWQPKSKKESGWVSRFGELRGLTGIRAQRQIELLPYTLVQGETFEQVPGDPFRDGTDGTLQFGLDGKVGVSSNLTFDFTVNPDFGQVEADPSEVNLTAFETRFAEKRPFFIEGNSILNFQLAPSIAGGSFTEDNLFYSRRIGRSPHGFPDLADGEYVDMPSATSIIGAGKLTGRTGSGMSIGLLESVTAEEEASISTTTGPERASIVEPLTNFLVGRSSQDWRGGDVQLGGMATAVNRRLDGSEVDFLHASAYTAGIDFRTRWRNKRWYVAGTVAGSHVEGSPEALLLTQTSSARYYQRPDNDYEEVDPNRTTLQGHAGSMRLGKSSGAHWRFETGAAWRSPGFEINDAGFLRRADELNQFTWVGYQQPNPIGIFRRFGINANQWLDWDFGGTLITKRANTNFNMNFRNNWAMGSGLTRTWERISNDALRGGPSQIRPGQLDLNFWVDTDQRRRVYASFGGFMIQGDEDFANFWEAWLDLSYRPSNALRFTLSPYYSHNLNDQQYVTETSLAGDPRYLFGSIDQRTAILTVRFDYTIRPNLTLQFYGSPFVSMGSYEEFKRVTNPHADRYEDRSHTFGPTEIVRHPATPDQSGSYDVDETGDGTTDYSFTDPNFDFRDFNSNLVARWEFSPGSVAYIVWSQARSSFAPVAEFDFAQGARRLFETPAHNVFLFKVSKWFSL